jgi:hypothetical protein
MAMKFLAMASDEQQRVVRADSEDDHDHEPDRGGRHGYAGVPAKQVDDPRCELTRQADRGQR